VSFSPADSLALADDNGLKHLLSQLGLTLLHGGEEHIANGTGREAIESSTDHGAGNHVQVLSSSVVSAVHDRSHRKRVRNLQLDSVASPSCCKSTEQVKMRAPWLRARHPDTVGYLPLLLIDRFCLLIINSPGKFQADVKRAKLMAWPPN